VVEVVAVVGCGIDVESGRYPAQTEKAVSRMTRRR
jgi:hypothetical protein